MYAKKTISAILTVILIFCLLFPGAEPVQAASSSEIQMEIDELEQKKDALLAQLE